jgi:tRNA A-37 threonylcarbamoyl transferase component Bud32
VDEYQDTNFSQYLIVKQLGKMHENVCVVGDDAQSIYSFRGANFKNIIDFTLNIGKNKDVRFKMDGFASIKSGFISTTLPIKYETTLKEYLKGLTPNT